MTTIEGAKPRLRALLAEAAVDLADGPSAVLPVFRRFCEEEIQTASDMILWEVGDFGEWVQAGQDWHQTDPLWMFSICRQLERGSEWDATEDEPSGFFQIQCSWHYAPGLGSQFAEWRAQESTSEFFDRIVRSTEYAHATSHPFEKASLLSTWV